MKDFKFEIFNADWQAKFVNQIEQNDPNRYTDGTACSSVNLIKVATRNVKNETMSKKQINIIFLHELVHAILSTGAYLDEAENEALTEWIANCLYSLNEQGIFDKIK